MKLQATPVPDSVDQSSSSFFPILIYNSDIGFGYGGKGVVKNRYHRKESFDLTLFGSTKGQQWYEFRFSIPDGELRQQTIYRLALDVRIEYNKQLKSNFFGFGNLSRDNRGQFPREFIKIEFLVGRAFTPSIIVQSGLFLNFCSVYDFKDVNPVLRKNIPGAGEKHTSYITGRFLWDTRNSRIHPSRGWLWGLNSDFAFKTPAGDYNFQRFRTELNYYLQIISPDHILAWRLWGQHVNGTAPYYEQSIIGGTWTSRGYKADRFIDRAMLLSSAEYRFMIFKTLGGTLFTDIGRTFSGIKKFTFKNHRISKGAGLRYYLKNFVVRFDVGFSPEGTRLFLHFGHVY